MLCTCKDESTCGYQSKCREQQYEMPTKVVWQTISSDWRMKFQKSTPSLPTGGWVSWWDRFRKRAAKYMWGISRVSAMASRGQSIEWYCTSFAVSCENRSQPNMYVSVPGSDLGHTVCANSPDLFWRRISKVGCFVFVGNSTPIWQPQISRRLIRRLAPMFMFPLLS